MAKNPTTATTAKPRNIWFESWQILRANKMALASMWIVFVIMLLCFSGTIISNVFKVNEISKKHSAINVNYGAKAPSIFTRFHPFGTDELGRDLFFRTLVGGCISISVGITAALIALLIGVTVGSFSAYLGGSADSVIMRIIDIIYSLPLIVFVILISTMTRKTISDFVAEHGLKNYHEFINVIVLFILIGSITWLTMARIVRSQILTIKNREFIEAVKIMKVSKITIILRHMLPNIMGPVIVYATLSVPSAMLTEATLSFLGLGVQPPLSSWGSLISDGASKIDVYPWLLFFPALFFFLTLFALNFLGDGLRDALDPKMAKK